MYQQDLLTGLIQLSSPKNKQDDTVIFYVNGQIICLYQHHVDGYVRHEAHSKNAVLPKSEVELQSYQIAAHFIRPMQGLFEKPKTGQSRNVATSAVPDVIEELEKSSEPLLAHFHWPSADGFSLIPGNGLASRQLMFWSQNQTSPVPNFMRWSEPECVLTTYRGSMESRAWRENYMMLGMDFLYERIFKRYDELVGSSMTARLEEQLNAVSRMQGWQISFSGHRLQDTHFFASFSDMRIAYRTLLMTGQHHVSDVVGEKLFEQSVIAAARTLPSELRTILEGENILSNSTSP